MNITTTPQCEAVFLHIYVDDLELERIAKRLRLTPTTHKYPLTETEHQRICYKLHNNVTIYVYGDLS